MYGCILDLAAWHGCQGVPEFPLAWFEDEAFCYKLNKMKYNIAVSYRSLINHKGSITVKSLVIKNKKNLEIMKSNIELLNKIRKEKFTSDYLQHVNSSKYNEELF